MLRRSFLQLLGSLPFLGWVKPEVEEKPQYTVEQIREITEMYFKDYRKPPRWRDV